MGLRCNGLFLYFSLDSPFGRVKGFAKHRKLQLTFPYQIPSWQTLRNLS